MQEEESDAKGQIAQGDRRGPDIGEWVDETGERCHGHAGCQPEVECVERDEKEESEVEIARHPSREPHEDEDEGQVKEHRDAVEQEEPSGAERVDQVEERAVRRECHKEPHDLTVRLRIERVIQRVYQPPGRAPEQCRPPQSCQPAVHGGQALPENRLAQAQLDHGQQLSNPCATAVSGTNPSRNQLVGRVTTATDLQGTLATVECSPHVWGNSPTSSSIRRCEPKRAQAL